MIPEWCKRAAEEIERSGLERTGCEINGVDYDLAAATIAKHAEGRVIFYHKFPDKLSLQVDELVEAARASLRGDLSYHHFHEHEETCDDCRAANRLRRALEPFNE